MTLPPRGERRTCACKHETCPCRGRCRQKPKVKSLCESCAAYRSAEIANEMRKAPYEN